MRLQRLREVGGMQTGTEMQVMDLMLNRCDSRLERQTGSSFIFMKNTTAEGAGGRYTPENAFFWLLRMTVQKTHTGLEIQSADRGGASCCVHGSHKRIMCTLRSITRRMSPFFPCRLSLTSPHPSTGNSLMQPNLRTSSPSFVFFCALWGWKKLSSAAYCVHELTQSKNTVPTLCSI